ncbi:hypothetical protein KJ575_00480 [Patescibacteria group bacterium]|nr:hypothetical protein [Patescibacteria group bacterium]
MKEKNKEEKKMKNKISRETILVYMVIVFFVAGLLYGHIQFEKGHQVRIQEGVRFGFDQVSLNPTKEIQNQIHKISLKGVSFKNLFINYNSIIINIL